MPTISRNAAMAGAATRFQTLLPAVIYELDRLHVSAVEVPEVVREAMRTLTAYSVALACNAQGQPTPPEFRAALGLSPSPAGTGL